MSLTLSMACLALNVYFEARNQPIAGQVAIAQVTMNRVKDNRYPDNVCDVIYEGGEEVLHKCQFSWYCDGRPDIPYNEEAWATAQLVASAVMAGSGHVSLEGVTHYHAVYVKPYWSEKLQYVAQIGDHKFYSEIM